MDKPNVLFCVVDCLRKDYVVPKHMAWLSRFGQNHISFENYWGSSHCTDPSITHMLSGKHPDELGLYSMMFEDKSYSIPKDTTLLMHRAKAEGYTVAAVANCQRWYLWGSDYPKDTRDLPRGEDYRIATELAASLPEPWFIFFHSFDMHTYYADGSYAAAAKYTDCRLELVARAAAAKDAAIFIIADHGEGLGESGPDGRVIEQHGYGLWDFLTHLPLLMKLPSSWPHRWKKEVSALAGHDQLHEMILDCFRGRIPTLRVPEYIFQAGATPDVFHRGVVTSDRRQFVRATYPGSVHKKFWIGEFDATERYEIEAAVAAHCTEHGRNYGEVKGDEIVLDRLKGLGYFE